jgi:hypothetical protein
VAVDKPRPSVDPEAVREAARQVLKEDREAQELIQAQARAVVAEQRRDGIIRRYLVEAVLILAIGGGLWALQQQNQQDAEQSEYNQDVSQIEAERDSCTRVNEGVRDPVYFVLKAQSQNSQDTDRQFFQTGIDMMVEAVAEHPQSPSEIRAALNDRFPVDVVAAIGDDIDQYRTDCISAFPLPEKP